jgi:hypothetical protein
VSAFLKGDTWEQYVAVNADPRMLDRIPKGQATRIKIEIDTDPPPGFATESRFLLQPVPFPVRAFCLPDLLAGKMHAALCREWKNRVKGRDWYDIVWYAAHHPELHLSHLEKRMRQSGHLDPKQKLTAELFLRLYREKVERLDVDLAVREVSPFVRNRRMIDGWSRELFLSLAERFRIL